MLAAHIIYIKENFETCSDFPLSSNISIFVDVELMPKWIKQDEICKTTLKIL